MPPFCCKLGFVVYPVGADAHIGPFSNWGRDAPNLKPYETQFVKNSPIEVDFSRRADVGIGPYEWWKSVR